MNLLQKIESQLCKKLVDQHPIPNFRAGDRIIAIVPRKVVKKSNKKGKPNEEYIFPERIEGVCISRTSRGMGSNVNIRRTDINTNLIVPLYGTQFEVIRRGMVRRAKLYYFNNLKGKKARIKELKKAVAVK